MANLAIGEIVDERSGLALLGGLGALSSLVSIDRQKAIAGPVPVAIDATTFSVDLAAISGNYIALIVSSNKAHSTKWIYCDWLQSRPTVVWAVTPLDLADCKGAKICSYTQLWVPLHAQAFFEGRCYWNRVCPTGKPGPEAMRPPDGILVTSTGDGTLDTNP